MNTDLYYSDLTIQKVQIIPDNIVQDIRQCASVTVVDPREFSPSLYER